MDTAPPRLGILMLDTRFPRIKGDVGNPETWDFPVRYAVVAGATPEAVVCSDVALEQVPMIAPMLAPARRVGVLTISGATLSSAHLAAAGVPQGTPVRGVEDTGFARSILGNETALDVDLARREMVAAAQSFVADHPELGALVLECTNMPPYATDIAQATGLPVFSITTYLNWFHAALAPARG